MKKILCILTSVMLLFGTFSVGVLAEEEESMPAAFNLLNPRRVNLYCPDGYDGKNLKLNNELVYDEDGNITGRTIINEASGSQNGGGLRFKGTYMYGSLRWKNSFTYEFDFKVDTIPKQFIMTIGAAKIRFAQDTQNPEQYFINWEGDSNAQTGGISHKLGTIWAHPKGELLQIGKTYHLRIEADMTLGGNVFVTFSDPETGRVHTSSRAHGASYTTEQYENEDKCYSFTISCVDPLSLTTSNEEMYYETFFILSHEIQAEENSSTVKASSTVLNCTNDSFNTVPYLLLNVYDSNGVMVKSEGTTEGEVKKQENADNKYLTSKCSYSTEVDISNLSDGDYTVKTFMWRSPDEMIVCKEANEKTITVKDGVVAPVENSPADPSADPSAE